MAFVAQYQALAGYNRWMNGRLYTLAAELTDQATHRDRPLAMGTTQAPVSS